MAPRLARAALTRTLRGSAGLVVLLTACGVGVAQAALTGSLLAGALVGTATMAVVGAVSLWSATRAFRRMAPAGQVLTSRYDAHGRLAVTTGIGTSHLTPGTVDRGGRSGSLVQIRLRPGGRWALLPGELLTDEDLCFLAGNDGVNATLGPTPSALPLATMPTHLVSRQTQRDLRGALLRRSWRTPGTRLLLGLAVIGVACAALTPTLPTLAALGVGLLLMAFGLAGPALAVRRHTPVGQLLRAEVTPEGLVLHQGESESVLPWSSFRSCDVSHRAVVLVLRSGAVIPLPGDLFPGTELVRLQRHVIVTQLEPALSAAPAPVPAPAPIPAPAPAPGAGTAGTREAAPQKP
jgi:hypothetical protein